MVHGSTLDVEGALTLSPDQHDLAAAARGFAAARWQPGHGAVTVNAVRELWRRAATELGIVGLATPGQEGTLTDLCVVAAEWAMSTLPAPLVTQAALVAPELARLAPDSHEADELLSAVLAGELLVSPAVRRDDSSTVVSSRDGLRVTASLPYVADGQLADHLLIRVPHIEGHVWVVVDVGAHGVVRRPLAGMDPTRLHAAFQVTNAAVTVLGPASAHQPNDEALICLAAELAGTAQQGLDLAIRHITTRRQFGRTVGGFQGVKHRAARMLVDVETAQAVWMAAALAQTSSTRSGEVRERALESAIQCGEAAASVTADLIGLLGAIGFTREHAAHVVFRRARAGQDLLGDARDYQRELDLSLDWPTA